MDVQVGSEKLVLTLLNYRQVVKPDYTLVGDFK